MEKNKFPTWTVPFALLALCIISFGTLIPKLGLYWDDWPSLWFIHFFGPTVFPDVFTTDRPTLGWIFMLTTWLMGESMLAWHLFAIITRWLSGVALWWVLRLIWPRRIIEVTWIAFLFVVYPGFKQQLIPITYSHMFIMLTIFLLSLGTMILAYRKPRWFWPLILTSLFTSAMTLFTLEYYVGLELLRPVILLLTDDKERESFRTRLLLSLKRWLPYIFILLLFLLWRMTNKTPRGQITLLNDLRTNPITTIVDLTRTIFLDIFESSVLAWIQTINPQELLAYRTTILLVIVGIILITSALTIFFMLKLRSDVRTVDVPKQSSPLRWEYQAILLGIYSLIIGGWPIWATNLKMDLFFPWDRFTLMMMLGAALLLVGLVFLITRTRLQSTLILAVIVGLSVGMHFQTGLSYMRDWNFQKAFFWQLVWRAPDIEPGTLLLTSKLPFQYATDNSLTAPLNWTYAPENYTRQMPYGFVNIDARLGNMLSDLEEATPLHQPYRATSFDGSTSQALLIHYSPEICLKVIDPEADRFWPYQPGFIPSAIHLSDRELIITDPEQAARPPIQVFGPEPTHEDWCYFFEKAELSRQKGNWEHVAELGDEALQLDKEFNKKNASELVTYIEGYAHVGRWQDAVGLSTDLVKYSEIMRNPLCNIWKELSQNTSPDEGQRAAIAAINNKLNCDIP